MIWRMILRDRKRSISLILVILILAGSMPAAIALSDSNIIQIHARTLDLMKPSLEISLSIDAYLEYGPFIGPGEVSLIISQLNGMWENVTSSYQPSHRVTGYGGGILVDFALAGQLTAAGKPISWEEARGLRALKSPSGYTLISGTLAAVGDYFSGGESLPVVWSEEPYYLLAPLGAPEELGIVLLDGRYPEPGGDPPEAALYVGLADYYNVGVGDEVAIAGARLKIVGVFDLEGSITLTTAGYNSAGIFIAAVVDKDDIDAIARDQAESISSDPILAATFTLIKTKGLGMPLHGPYTAEFLLREYGNRSLIMIPSGLWRAYTSEDAIRAIAETIVSLAEQDQTLYQALLEINYVQVVSIKEPGVLNVTVEKPSSTLQQDIEDNVYYTLLNAMPGPGDSLALLIGVNFDAEEMIRELQGRDPAVYYETVTREEVYSILSAIFGPEEAENALSPIYSVDMITLNLDSGRVRASVKSDLLYAYMAVRGDNAIIYFSFLAVAVLIILVGGRTAVEAASLIVRDYRPFLAMIIARGQDPGRLKRSISLLVLLLSLATGLLGGVGAYLLFVHVAGLPTLVGPGTFLILGVIGSLMVGLYISVRTMRVVSEIRAIEAVRPVESLVSGYRRLGKRVGVALALALVSVGVGLAGGPEVLFRRVEAGGALTAVAVILLFIGFLYAPLAPATLAYYTAYLLEGVERLYRATTRVAARIAGPLADLAQSSGARLKDRMASNITTMSVAFGVAVGSALGYLMVSSFTETLLRSTIRDPYGLGVAASLDVATYMFKVLSAFAVIVGAIASLASAASTFRLVEGEVVVLRARGADRGSAARFIYGMMAPVVLYTFIVSLVAGAVLAVSIISLSILMATDILIDYGLSASMFLAPPDSWLLTILLASAAALALSPLVVSYGVLRRGEIARLLRERRMG